MTLDRSLFSSATGCWNTPSEILDLVRQLGPIVLDPCPGEGDVVRALVRGQGDGLSLNWHAYGVGIVWVNPPYGRGIGAWMEKCADSECNGVDVVALVPARTDAAWWQDTVPNAASVCFWRGRIQFMGAPASAPFPSALIYWGQRAARFEQIFKNYGWVVRP